MHPPDGSDFHDIYGVFVNNGHATRLLFHSDEDVGRLGDLVGHFRRFTTPDMNRWGAYAFFGTREFFKRRPDGSEDFKASESGVFLKHPESPGWQLVLKVGDPAPGGGEVTGTFAFAGSPNAADEAAVWLSDRGDLCFAAKVSANMPDGSTSKQAILYRPRGGTWTNIVAQGDTLSFVREGITNNITVYALRMVGMNNHGQVAFLAATPDWHDHLFAYANGRLTRIAGYSDPSPVSPAHWDPSGRVAPEFTSGNGMTAGLSNGKFPAGPEGEFLPEMVFQTPVWAGLQHSPWFKTTFDVYSFTLGRTTLPVLLGRVYGGLPPAEMGEVYPGAPVPDPPGGILNLEYAQLGMNAEGAIVVHAKTARPDGAEVIVLTSLDRDGDGLPDSWEEDGLDVDGDGAADLDLKALGANPRHKDLFVEVDYMTGEGHSHRPDTNAIQQVVQAFAEAPVENPDGTNGIALHIDLSEAEAIPEIPFLKAPEDWETLTRLWFGAEADRANTNRLAAKRAVFRYCIFAHQYQRRSGGVWRTTTSSGLAEVGGNDFLVTLGGFTGGVGTADQQAATFMHELGHTLGLRHGGDDSINGKPNYLSVMNYSRQFEDFVPGRPLDYSRTALPDLDENQLSEPDGIGGAPGQTNVFFVDTDGDGYNDHYAYLATHSPVNWNWNTNATETAVAKDINSLVVGWHGPAPVWMDPARGAADAALAILHGFNDWAHLQYNFRASASYGKGVDLTGSHPEMDWETYQAMRTLAIGADRDRPRLRAALVGPRQIELTWSTNWTGLTLQTSSGLSPAGSWTVEPAPPRIVGDHYQVTLPASDTKRFFRLQSE